MNEPSVNCFNPNNPLRFLSVFSAGLMAVLATAQTAPFGHTLAAGPVTATNATLKGMIVPNGLPTTAWFEWGTNDSFGGTSGPVELGNGTSVISLSANIDGLVSGQVFQYRLIATNASGTAVGSKQLFSTGKKVAAWGGNWSGQANVPLGLANVAIAAAGGHHNVALTADGLLVPWGYSGNGEAAIPPDMTNAAAFSCGMAHCLALTLSGRVIAWGYNGSGQTNVPGDLTNAVAVAAGLYHSMALIKDGVVIAWGNNASGQCSIPAGLSNVVAISGGADHSMALKADGTVVAWGDNYWGQRNVPAGLTNITAISAGRWHSLALKQDGTVVAWGHSSYGATSVPVGLTSVVAIAGGYSHSLALKEDRTVVTWGGTIDGPGSVPAGLSDIASISSGSGSSHCLVIANNLPPTASSQTNSTIANHDLTIQLSALDRNGDAMSFRIATLQPVGHFISAPKVFAVPRS